MRAIGRGPVAAPVPPDTHAAPPLPSQSHQVCAVASPCVGAALRFELLAPAGPRQRAAHDAAPPLDAAVRPQAALHRVFAGWFQRHMRKVPVELLLLPQAGVTLGRRQATVEHAAKGREPCRQLVGAHA